jgi:hypothetical protein
MARSTGVTVWRCDRCNKRSEQPGDRPPPGWQRVESQPMDGEPAATDAWDVCEGCSSLVQRLLQPVDQPDNRSRQAIGSGPPLTEVQLVRGYSAMPEDER